MKTDEKREKEGSNLEIKESNIREDGLCRRKYFSTLPLFSQKKQTSMLKNEIIVYVNVIAMKRCTQIHFHHYTMSKYSCQV